MPDRNVTPSTTGSSQQNRTDNGTESLLDRLAEIRARLDALPQLPWRMTYFGGEHQTAVSEVYANETPVRRIAVFRCAWNSNPLPESVPRFMVDAPADIAWLLDEVERYMAIVRANGDA